MTDLVRFLADFVFGILLIPALVAAAFLTLYLPSLIITRGLYYFRRNQGPAMRILSRRIGPSIPGRGADRSALRHALTLWAMLGLKTVSCATTLLVIGSGYALFGVAVEGWVEIAFYTVMFTAFFAAVVSGVECVFLLVRLALHAPSNPTDTLAPSDNSDPHRDCVNPPNGPRPPFSRARLAAPRARLHPHVPAAFSERALSILFLRDIDASRDTTAFHQPRLRRTATRGWNHPCLDERPP